jgi:ABC-type proline/glycine betaine transport system substrate-binding protein
MRKFFSASAVALAAALTALPAMAQESADPIKLTLHDWTGQLITTEIMGEVLKQAGYNVEYVQADYLAQFAGLESGDLHVAMEMWETTGRDAMDASTATGKTENLRPDRHEGQGRVVVPFLHEGEVPRPAQLGSAEGRRHAPRPSRRPRPRPRAAISAGP